MGHYTVLVRVKENMNSLIVHLIGKFPRMIPLSPSVFYDIIVISTPIRLLGSNIGFPSPDFIHIVNDSNKLVTIFIPGKPIECAGRDKLHETLSFPLTASFIIHFKESLFIVICTQYAADFTDCLKLYRVVPEVYGDARNILSRGCGNAFAISQKQPLLCVKEIVLVLRPEVDVSILESGVNLEYTIVYTAECLSFEFSS